MAKIRELKDVTITHVSYCKQARNNQQFLLSKSETAGVQDLEINVEFLNKADTSPQKLLYGIVYEPNTGDNQGDYMSEQEIEKAAHEYSQFYRNVDLEHNLKAGAGSVVESYIAPQDLTINGTEVKKGSWVLVTKADDEMWDAFQSGEITGYSMKGIAREVLISKGESVEKSWLRKALDFVGISKSFDETVQTQIDSLTMSQSFIMDMISRDFWESVEWDFSKTAELEALSTTLKEAAQYVDKKIAEVTVSKSEDENKEQVEIIKAEGEESATVETTEEIPVVEKEPEVVAPVVTETEETAVEQKPEEIQKANVELQKAEILSAVTSAINESLVPLKEQIDTLTQKIQVIETGSSVVVQKATQVRQPDAGASLLF